MGMKEKVGLGSDRNTTPSSDWLIPLSHLLIVEDVVCPAEETSANKVSAAVMASRVCGASVDVPASNTGSMLVVPAFMGGGGVRLPSTSAAPGQSPSSPSVPTFVALLGDHAVALNPVPLSASIAGAKESTLGTFGWLWGRGGGTVHPIIWIIGGRAWCTGTGLWITISGVGGGLGTGGHDGGTIAGGEVVGLRPIEGVPMIGISVQFEVRVSCFVVIGHGFRVGGGGRGWDVGWFVREVKRGRCAARAEEVVDFGWFHWLTGVRIRRRREGVGEFW